MKIPTLLIMLMMLMPLASAYTLQDYPVPFRLNTFYGETAFVVGDSAVPPDTRTALYIGESLERQARSSIGTEEFIPDSGFRIGKNDNKFLYGMDLATVRGSAVTKVDMPNVLAQKTLLTKERSITYDQQVKFTPGAGQFELMKPKDKPGGSYLVFPKNTGVYTYKLQLQQGVKKPTNLEGRTIAIQGRDYLIQEVKATGTTINSLKLSRDNVRVWLSEDDIYVYNNHEITVIGATDAKDVRCTLMVDGQILRLEEDKEKKVFDMPITLLDAGRTKYGALCELTLGGTQMTLENGNAVKIQGKSLKGSEVKFLGSSGSWEGFSVSYETSRKDNMVDRELSPGQSWIDPVFGAWKLAYEGVQGDMEEVWFESTNRRSALHFTSLNGVDVVLPYTVENGETHLGDKRSILLPGESYTGDPEDVQMLYVSDKGEARIIQISDIACNSNTITIKDVTKGTILVRNKPLDQGCNDSPQTITLGGLGSISLSLSNSALTYNSGSSNVIRTKNGALTVGHNKVVYTESQSKAAASTISLDLNPGNRITAKAKINNAEPAWIKATSKSHPKIAVTAKGTHIKYDDDDKENVFILAPKLAASAQVFMQPVSGQRSSDENIVEHIETIIQSHIDSRTKLHNIIVGGPCANPVAKELLGVEDCTEGFVPGQAIIKVFTVDNRATLLVAGYSAEDTRMAADVLVDHNNYALFGTEVIVERTAAGIQLKI